MRTSWSAAGPRSRLRPIATPARKAPTGAPGRATLAEVRPYLEQVIDSFGPERCLWGSDWPVVDTRADLPTWIAEFRTILEGYSEAEQAAMAHGTATRVYGVTLTS